MCIPGIDPITLLTIASTVGGSLINSNIQNAAISEQNKQNQRALALEQAAREAEVARQRGFEQEQADLVTKALFEASPDKIAQEGEAVAANPDAPINAALDDFNTIELAGQVQNKDVNDSIGATIASRTARTRELLRNAATLSGQEDGLSDAMEALGRLGSEVQTIGSNRRGSLNVSQLETRVPTPTVTPSGSPIGDLLILGGAAAGGIAGNKAGAAGRKPFDFGGIFGSNRPLNAIPALGRVTV